MGGTFFLFWAFDISQIFSASPHWGFLTAACSGSCPFPGFLFCSQLWGEGMRVQCYSFIDISPAARVGVCFWMLE